MLTLHTADGSEGKSILGDLWRSRVFRKCNLFAQDICECSVSVLAFKWSGAVKHLEDKDAQCPPIYGARVAAPFNNFGRDIFLRSNKRICSEVGYAGFGVDRRKRRGTCSILSHNHSGLTTRARLLG